MKKERNQHTTNKQTNERSPSISEQVLLQPTLLRSRMILKKLASLKRVDAPQPEFEAVKVLKELRHVTVNDEGTAVFEMHMENLTPEKNLM